MIGNRAAACMWRFWIEGKEIYATVRLFGPTTKFSIHHSGQIHMRKGAGAPLIMAPAVPVENSPWLNALELRFLTSGDAIAPPEEKLKEKDFAYGIAVHPGHFLHLNVLVVRGLRAPVPLPQATGMHLLWSTTLSTQEPVALIARHVAYNDENCERLRYIRHELNPHATFDKPVTEAAPYVELRDVHWSPGGNVVFIVPMGHEGYRAPVA
jgi:hypothetical protein